MQQMSLKGQHKEHINHINPLFSLKAAKFGGAGLFLPSNAVLMLCNAVLCENGELLKCWVRGCSYGFVTGLW